MAFREATCKVYNMTSNRFTFAGSDRSHGVWRVEPPGWIDPDEIGSWTAEF